MKPRGWHIADGRWQDYRPVNHLDTEALSNHKRSAIRDKLPLRCC